MLIVIPNITVDHETIIATRNSNVAFRLLEEMNNASCRGFRSNDFGMQAVSSRRHCNADRLLLLRHGRVRSESKVCAERRIYE